MTETQFFALTGGLDLITPAIRTPAGRCIAAVNYEAHPRGYQRVDGYERFDGHTRPSDASYWVLDFDAGTDEVLEGETVTGGTSGATGVALIDAVVESGSFAGNDAAGYLVLTEVSGEFQDDEALSSASGAMTADGTEDERGADNDTDDSTWIQDAIETARADIAKVPGSGPVRGVWMFDGDTYAFRDNAGGTAGVMHKATDSGWSAQDLGNEIAFDAGTDAFTEGETVTGGTSGATATINRVVLEGGDWSTDDAVGRLILGAVTGSFQDNETITDPEGGSATSDGADAAITLPAGGRYDFDNYNFFGASDLKRMYGCQGEGRGFEWDGSVFVPINTGMDDDRPTRVAAHRNHLFFAFRGGSVQHSSIGNPYQWDVVTGAGELGIGEEIADLLASVSGVLAIFGLNKVATLFGDDASNWELRILNDSAGAVARTAQTIGLPTYLDNRGLRTLETTEQFGDFLVGTITQLVEPIFGAKQKAGVTAVGSTRVRSKDQYRLFWSDGTGLTAYFGRDPVEIMPFKLDFTIECTCSGKDGNGDERLFAGDGDGMVYELDAGTSFDGSAVDAFIRLPFNHVGTPAQKKRWQKASLEVDARPDTNLGIVAEFGYADPDQPPGNEQDFNVRGSGGFWEESNWDDFYWSMPVEGVADAHIDGLGRNMSIAIVSSATYERPHILHGLILHFTYRGIAR